MSTTRFSNGLILGGVPVAGESDNKIYVYNSSGTLVGTVQFAGDLTIPDDVTFADETSGFSITQNSAKLTVGSNATLANGTTGFTLTQNSATLTVPQSLNLTQAAAPTTALTTITCSPPGTPDYDITNLTNSSPYGFASADEGQSVLTVIANLQTRLAELESKLQTMGLLAT